MTNDKEQTNKILKSTKLVVADKDLREIDELKKENEKLNAEAIAILKQRDAYIEDLKKEIKRNCKQRRRYLNRANKLQSELNNLKEKLDRGDNPTLTAV